jgi:hypothetical protein
MDLQFIELFAIQNVTWPDPNLPEAWPEVICGDLCELVAGD